MFAKQQKSIEDEIRAICKKSNIPLKELKWTTIPFSGEWGISTSFFQTAADEARAGKNKGIPVPLRAQQIAEQVKDQIAAKDGISHVEAIKGYLNLYFSTSEYARQVVDEVLASGPRFGQGLPKKERVMVEYAQPNTHHSFHIGHARNALLGESLSRLVEFAGFDTIRSSYPGDIGLGVITILWAYDKFYKGMEPAGIHERGQWLLKIYSEATALLEPKENETPEERQRRETYDRERREMYRKWDAGDEYVRGLWRKTREWSLEELRDILRILDIRMDVWFFESEVDEPAKEIVNELIAKGIAVDERLQGGAVVVNIDRQLGLTREKYRSNILLRSDGTTLYLTKDLALAKVKFEKYHVDRSIYVVDYRQNLHLQQAFKILELWGFKQAQKCHHLSYGFVTLPDGAMSARRGRVVLFKEVLDEAIRRVLAVESEKTPDMPAELRLQVAEQIGLGALCFSMLSVDNNKDIVFDMDTALSFDGRTGPYIQNAHVRACSILKKAPALPPQADFSYNLDAHEIQLIDLLSRFPATVEQAALEYRPLVMASYAYELANTFHSFYHAVPVLQTEDKAIREARLRLVAASKQVIANALRLLVIKAPEVM
jgi:arginyl-tRNA synthetase